jgi:NTE family protein
VLLGVLGRRDHLVPNRAFEAFLRDKLPLTRLEGGAIPLHVVTTDLLTGEIVALSDGDALPAVMASSALPGVFPPVDVAGRRLVDGGVAGNTPVDHAVALGATEVYVLPAGIGRRLHTAPRTAWGLGAHSLGLLIEQRLIAAVGHHQPGVTLRVAPTPGVRILPLDFSTTSELIEAAERLTDEWLEAGAP